MTTNSQDQTPEDDFEEIEGVEFELSYSKIKESAIFLGPGDINDPNSGRRVRVGPSRGIYISVTTKHGNLKIWKVASSHFIFATEEDPPRYITAKKLRKRWLPVWQRGSDPESVDEKNMSTDDRVWQVFEDFEKYFLRLEMNIHLYLISNGGKLTMHEVSQPNNTRNLTPLRIVKAA